MPVTVEEVKWGEDLDISKAPQLNEEELHSLKKRMEALDKVLADAKKAKYKIELMFGSEYSSHHPFPGALSLWESGAKLHGGGDTKVYECPGKALKVNECAGLIPDSSTGYGYLLCPSCKTVWKGEQVHGEVLARLSNQGWATLLYRYFVKLGHNADIYVKRPHRDIRRAAETEQLKQRKGEVLQAARSRREVFIYPLINIIKDVSAGADPVKRFRSLLAS